MEPSRYWKICQISLTCNSGYEYRPIPSAQEFFQSQFSTSTNHHSESIQVLLSYFRTTKPAIAPISSAQAGLCLRCRVSHPILKACQTLANLFSGGGQITYLDLLPFVLNDDGKTLIVLDSDGRTQLKLDDGKTQPATFKIFAVEVLRTFKLDSSSMSLDNWAFLQTKQSPELKNFLSEFGFQHLTDWALLNQARPKQIEQLAERDRLLVQVFHTVYRRDRRQQQEVNKCSDPNSAQLTEMRLSLQKQNVSIATSDELMKLLKQAAQQLRQYDIWQYRTPLEVQNVETGGYELRQDLPACTFNEFDGEQEFLEFLHQQLQLGLANAIQQGIAAQRTQLEKSRKYAPFASNFVLGLQLYYCQGMSLKEVAPALGMSSWDQARRVLNPGELVTRVRTLTLQQMFDQILKKAQAEGLASTPSEPNYLKSLSEQIEAFVDAEIFEEAATEIKAGKNRSMDSAYARQLKVYIEKYL